VVKKLGEGGQSSVYSVIDPDTSQNFAIKLISVKNRKQEKRELEVVMNENLNHINIVRYFSSFRQKIKGKIFTSIIMELCEEGNLEDFCKKFDNNIIPEKVYYYFSLFIIILLILFSMK
jgi:serine/threonine protein kinase